MPKTFPKNARLNRVLGIIKMLDDHGGKLELNHFARMSRQDVGTLHPQLEAAKMLGLVNVQKGKITLTSLGIRLRKDGAAVNKEVLNRLKKYEPFRTAERRAERGFSVEELALLLTEKKVYWHTNEKRNQEALKDMLIQWAIFFKLASYSGASRRWSKAKSHISPA